MRAIGVVLVILNHMWPWADYPYPLIQYLQLPWIMMDAFFVISGFLIAGILLDSRSRPDYYRSFYGRRTLRIFPLYYVVLIFITAATALNGHAAYRSMLENWGSPAWFYVYLGNMPSAIRGTEPTAGGGVFTPLWSLQVEEQFYLLFPFLIHRLQLQTLKRVMVVLCCISTVLRLLIYWQNPGNHFVQYVFLPCHMEGLAIGSWMAIRFRQGPWKVNKKRLSLAVVLWGALTVTVVCLGGFTFTTPLNRTLGLLLSPIWFGLVILWLIQFRGSSKTAWIRTPAMRYIGKISYAAYLLHWPVSNVITVLSRKLNLPQFEGGFTKMGLIYLFTFAASALSWHFFEHPIMRLKDKLFPASLRALHTQSEAV